MTDRDLYIDVFADVADRMGGHEALALKLDVNIDVLFTWATGRARPPTDVFLRTVALKETRL